MVAFDADYALRDIFYPQVGLENHTGGSVCRTGFFLDGRFAWEADPGWERELGYAEDTLVTEVTLRHAELGLRVRFTDYVDMARDWLFRNLELTSDRPVNVARVFFHYDWYIKEVDLGCTTGYDAVQHAVIAYKKDRYFLLGGRSPAGEGIGTWANGKKGGSLAGTWVDAQDGELGRNPIEQGSVDTDDRLRLRPARGRPAGGRLPLAVHGDRPQGRHRVRPGPDPQARRDDLPDSNHELLGHLVGQGQAAHPGRAGAGGAPALPAQPAHHPHPVRQPRRGHRRDRLRHHQVRPRHLQLRVAARRRPGHQRPRPVRPRGHHADLFRVLPAGDDVGGGRRLLPPQVHPGRHAGELLAPLGRRRRQSRPRDPGRRDGPRPLGPLGALPDPRPPRLRGQALLDPRAPQRSLHGGLFRPRHGAAEALLGPLGGALGRPRLHRRRGLGGPRGRPPVRRPVRRPGREGDVRDRPRRASARRSTSISTGPSWAASRAG